MKGPESEATECYTYYSKSNYCVKSRISTSIHMRKMHENTSPVQNLIAMKESIDKTEKLKEVIQSDNALQKVEFSDISTASESNCN